MSETLAVGDSLNDREMVMAAGLGVAVANARAELKAVADVVLERSAADGAIAELAERFFPEA
jgi:hydroxymethylpyrimidine pyrophosphatase-like HAD family hydrolase